VNPPAPRLNRRRDRGPLAITRRLDRRASLAMTGVVRANLAPALAPPYLRGVRRSVANRSDMPRKPTKSAPPSRDDVLKFLSGEPAPNGKRPPARVSKRDLARAFRVKGEAKGELKTLIRDLEQEGAVKRGRKILSRQGVLPAMLVADIAERTADGAFVAAPAEDDLTARILIRPSRVKRDHAPAPKVGMRVLLRVARDETSGVYSGRIVKVLDKAAGRPLGVYRKLETGGGRVHPVEKRAIGRDWFIPVGLDEGAKDGELVALAPLRDRAFGAPAARVVERLGPVDTERAISRIAIAVHGLPDTFSQAALAEAETAGPASMEAREDWRKLALVTIDPPDAKDHDDAVHAEAVEDGFVVTVAIADVSYYVRPSSALDREALERGNSVYFPDRVVPMLPERISNDLCSLKPDVDRPALAVRLHIDKGGRKTRHTFHRIMMRSAAKLSYEQAQRMADAGTDAILGALYAAYEAVKKERDQRDPLDLNLPERKLVLDEDGRLKDVRWPDRLDAHRLIEEFMILANVAAAETLEEKQSPLIYRAHDGPSVEKLNDLSVFLSTLGVKLAKAERLRPSHLNKALSSVKGAPHEALTNEVVLRAQSQAEYTHQNYGHFGLNLRRYAHFTSPIRRYADLVVHRALIRALGLGPGGLTDTQAASLSDVAERISAAERRAMAAERETADRLVATYLSERIGARFLARIAGVTKVGLFVKLADTGADGFIPAGTLGQDYFRFEEAARALVGTRTGETFRLGDRVEVKLVEAAPFAGALRFEMLSKGARASRSTQRRK
jgi:ribonuclease R